MREMTQRSAKGKALVVGVMAGAGMLATVALWLASDRTMASFLLSAIAIGGVAGVLALGDGRPILAVAIVFALASASRLVIETSLGTLRLEQPAILALVVVAALRVRRDGLHVPRQALLTGAAILAYLAVLAISSALVAPQPVASLRMTLWWSISAAGGAAAYLMVRSRAAAARDAIVAVGTGYAVIGVGAALVFLVAGPDVAPGIQETSTLQPRVYGLAWEANLYSSLVAAVLVLAIGAVGTRARLMLAATAVMAIALPLGGTRAAYVGLAAGLLAMVAVLAQGQRAGHRLRWSWLSSIGVVAASLAIGLASVGVLLPNNDVRQQRSGVAVLPSPAQTDTPSMTTPEPPPSFAAPSGSLGPTGTPTPPGTPTPSATAAPSATPRPSLTPAYDTLGFRLARVQPAIDDFRTSPLIGLGASSFGQRHADASQGGAPDHLPILALAVPYESGALGAIALGLALALTIAGLLRRAKGPQVLLAASLTGAVATLLVAYEATNALHFATNWILFGLAVAVAWDDQPLAIHDPRKAQS